MEIIIIINVNNINNKRLLLEEDNNESECYLKEFISYINIINSNDWSLNGISDDDEKLLINVEITNKIVQIIF